MPGYCRFSAGAAENTRITPPAFGTSTYCELTIIAVLHRGPVGMTETNDTAARRPEQRSIKGSVRAPAAAPQEVADPGSRNPPATSAAAIAATQYVPAKGPMKYHINPASIIG